MVSKLIALGVKQRMNPPKQESHATSIRSISPIEQGGVRARQGFQFQDHIAAGFLLDIVVDQSLKEVWCEVHDDLTLLWEHGSGPIEVEFVQAKSNELNQLWTPARLCEREGAKKGTSIFERSLANDRAFLEDRKFRLVLAQNVRSELSPLKASRSAQSRAKPDPSVAALAKDWPQHVREFRSPMGNDVGFWLERLRIHTRGEVEVEHASILKLQRCAESFGLFLMQDQLEECYRKIVGLAASAATRKRSPQLRRDDVLDFIQSTCERAADAASRSPSQRLAEKFEAAGLPKDSASDAEELRRSYRHSALEGAYLDLSHGRRVEVGVRAALHKLRAALDAGTVDESGPEFLHRCVTEIVSLRTEQDPPLEFFFGAMYEQTHRCTHRFVRAA